MKKIFLLVFYCFASLFFYQSVKGQQSDLSELDAYFEKALNDFDLTGMAIGIVKDGKVVFQKGYGFREQGKPEKVDENSLFAIASISKAFTVTALSVLEQDGKLSWGDPATQHLPYFKLHDPYVTSRMTVEDLTCHRSGLATFDGDLLWYGTDYGRKEIVERIRELPLKKEFRADFGYQNIMYISCGELIKEVSGLSWDDFLQKEIFNKLGMKQTVTSIRKFTPQTNLAYPHLNKDKIQLLNYDNSGATAAINSNVSDMCKWIQFWLGNGVVNGDTILHEANKRRMFTPHTNLSIGRFDRKNNTHFKSYGMGWFLMDYNGKKVIHHGGGLPGYISKIALVPESGLGMIILTNGMTSVPTALMYRIIDHFDGKNDRDWAAEFLTYKQSSEDRQEQRKKDRIAQRIAGTKPSHNSKTYEGVYTDKMYGFATITGKNGELIFSMEPTKQLFTSKMEHWHYDTFNVKFKDPFLPEGFVTFNFDEMGNVNGLKIDLPNPDFHFYNLNFTKVK